MWISFATLPSSFEPHPRIIAALLLHKDLRPVVFALAVLAAFLSANSLLTSRSSQPAFFSISVLLAAIALRPTLHLSILAAATAIFAVLFFTIDYIVRSQPEIGSV